MKIRNATDDDLELLNAIAFAAKAHWGYSPEQMALWKPELLTSGESLRSCPTFVAEPDGKIGGFSRLNPHTQPWELDALWVSPSYMRQGVGRALLDACKAAANAEGQSVLLIDSDPNAAAFYLSQGAIQVGVMPAPVPGQPGRVRPVFHLSTSARQINRY